MNAVRLNLHSCFISPVHHSSCINITSRDEILILLEPSLCACVFLCACVCACACVFVSVCVSRSVRIKWSISASSQFEEFKVRFPQVPHFDLAKMWGKRVQMWIQSVDKKCGPKAQDADPQMWTQVWAQNVDPSVDPSVDPKCGPKIFK